MSQESIRRSSKILEQKGESFMSQNTLASNIKNPNEHDYLRPKTLSKGDYHTTYSETTYRWFILTSYFLVVFANGVQWVTFSSVSTMISEAYDLEMWIVNMYSTIFMIIYPFAVVPESWLSDDYSLRIGIMVASCCTLTASAVKLFCNQSMFCCFIGQFLAGLFQPVLLSSPGKLAANWFNENVRTLICTLGCLADTLGILIGSIWSLLFIDENATGEKFKEQFWMYIFSEFIVNVFFCVPAFFIFKDRPDVPPAPSQDYIENPTVNTSEGLKMLLTNVRFIYLLVAFFFVLGYLNVTSTINTALYFMYGISVVESSLFYSTSCLIGIIASIFFSVLIDKIKKFRLFLFLFCLIGAFFHGLFTLLLELSLKYDFNKFAIGFVGSSLISAVIEPFHTIGVNYACEITFPAGESLSVGLLYTVGQLSGIGGTFLCQYFLDNYSEKIYISNVFLTGWLAMAGIFVYLVDNKLDRLEIDEKGRNKENKRLQEALEI